MKIASFHQIRVDGYTLSPKNMHCNPLIAAVLITALQMSQACVFKVGVLLGVQMGFPELRNMASKACMHGSRLQNTDILVSVGIPYKSSEEPLSSCSMEPLTRPKPRARNTVNLMGAHLGREELIGNTP